MAVTLAVVVGLLCAVNPGLLASARASQEAPQAAEVTRSSGMLNQVVPQRILDTRTTLGGHHAPLASGETMQLPVLGQGVPGAGVSAVLVNVTAVDETSHGYMTLFQTGVSRPIASSMDYQAGVPVANQALVRVGSDGTISIYNVGAATDVVIDVEGWVGIDSAAASGQTTTITPVRILDTRTTTGGHDGPLLPGSQSLTLPVTGVDGIPATGVSAVWANITAVPVGTAEGYLTAYPSDAASEPVSSIANFSPAGPSDNLVLLQVSATGSITITDHSTGANVVVDIAGWVSGGDVTADAGTQAIPQTRILDTRTALGGHDAPLAGNSTLSLPVLGVGGVPSTGVAAVVVHVTGVGPTETTYLSAYGTGFARPLSTMLNLTAGSTVASTVVVPVGPSGAITFCNEQSSLNVVVDVEGWIAAPTLTVVPPSAAALGAGGTLTSTDGQRAAAILTNANRYAMTTWWTDVYPALVAAPMQSQVTTDGSPGPTGSTTTVSAADNVRRLCMEAFSLATSLATGAYNPAPAPAGTGVPTATATARTIQIISTVAGAHLTNQPGGWGATSESEIDDAYLGAAAWFLWPQLSAQVQSEVARMVYFEAEWGADRPLQFYANAAGTVLTPGDTGADGDSWIPMPAQLAAVMMPGNSHFSLWQNTVVGDALAAWARPSDDTNPTVVNGAPVAAWLDDRGSNVLSGGDLYNHNRLAPDYSTLIYQNMQDIPLSSVAGVPAPQAVTTLLKPVYAAYTTVSYASPPNDSPAARSTRPAPARSTIRRAATGGRARKSRTRWSTPRPPPSASAPPPAPATRTSTPAPS